jgi:hypothetical protein
MYNPNNRIQLTKNFYLDEFVPPLILRAYGPRAIWFIDRDVVLGAQFIRDTFGRPMYGNTYFDGGVLENRGYRLPDSKVGSRLSQHKRGKAFDFTIEGITPQEIHEWFIKSFEFTSASHKFTTIEANTDTWTHLDQRNTAISVPFIVPFK